MITYRYYAILSDGEHNILYKGRATNIKNFRSEAEKQFLNSGCEISKCRRLESEYKREKKYFSISFVDMGQATR